SSPLTGLGDSSFRRELSTKSDCRRIAALSAAKRMASLLFANLAKSPGAACCGSKHPHSWLLRSIAFKKTFEYYNGWDRSRYLPIALCMVRPCGVWWTASVAGGEGPAGGCPLRCRAHDGRHQTRGLAAEAIWWQLELDDLREVPLIDVPGDL